MDQRRKSTDRWTIIVAVLIFIFMLFVCGLMDRERRNRRSYTAPSAPQYGA